VPNELIPELHDVLKLTGEHRHPQSRNPVTGPDTPTWKGAFYHSAPVDADTLRLHLADCLAAASSRPSGYGVSQLAATHKLWKDDPLREASKLELHEVLDFLASDPDWPAFADRYGEALEERAEEAGKGLNVTSLRTHMELTGKFYRLLEGRLDLSAVVQPANWGDANWVSGARETVTQQTKLTVSHLRVEFPQRPVRAKDLNVLIALAEAVARIAQGYPDRVIFAAGQELLVVSPDSRPDAALETELTAAGFSLQARRVTGTLAEWTGQLGASRASLLQLAEAPTQAVHGSLPEIIPPPICEICQMAPGRHPWTGPGEEEESEEYLCANCYGYRQRGARLPQLAAWESDPTTRRLAWFRLELPLSDLIHCLRGLYGEYLAQIGRRPAPDEIEVRFSLLAEFQRDYLRLLEAVRTGLRERFGEDNLQEVLPNLHCARLEDPGQALEVLSVYEHQVRELMPAFLHTQYCPLRARLIVADLKFPFGEIWRISEQATADVQVTLVGARRLRSTHRRLRDVLSLRNLRLRPSALHNLAEIARVSDTLAQLRWLDRSRPSDADTHTYQLIDRHLHWRREDASGLDFEGLVAFAQMASAARPLRGEP